jgi:hypothetical protein
MIMYWQTINNLTMGILELREQTTTTQYGTIEMLMEKKTNLN